MNDETQGVPNIGLGLLLAMPIWLALCALLLGAALLWSSGQ